MIICVKLLESVINLFKLSSIITLFVIFIFFNISKINLIIIIATLFIINILLFRILYYAELLLDEDDIIKDIVIEDDKYKEI